MRLNSPHIDTVRASRDGHEFHEAWAARLALRLVLRLDDLVGIAVEGLSPIDQGSVSVETVEIADLALYYGKQPNFGHARKVVITQAKYSISKATRPFGAADAATTLKKFAKAYRDHHRHYGAKAVMAKLEFEIVTNRPVAVAFSGALKGISLGEPLKGMSARQAKQIKQTCGLSSKQLAAFAKKLSITGATGSLHENKENIYRVIADWSPGNDSMALLRLGELRKMVRDKAGSIHQGHNVIKRVDVLAAMQVQSEKDLLPFPERLPKCAPMVPREQLDETLKIILTLNQPLLIHAEGGIGKTVFLQSIISKLSFDHKCIFFDCFDGGAYRAPEDGRHRPGRALVQIVNSLACSSLCDPLLPLNENVETLLSAFRRRLNQCVSTLRMASPTKLIILVIDAIDNAAEQARERKEDCFPTLLLESLTINGPIEGVKVIVSCRSHRRNLAKGHIECEEIELKPFSKRETESFLRGRLSQINDSHILVAHVRSGGNPRILDHLVQERGLMEPSEINRPVALDDLLKKRISSALEHANIKGYKRKEIHSFLAGLSVLPPPIPIDEYAVIHGLDVAAVKSFLSDLAPLLEQSKHGITFRDEPTETFIRENYALDTITLCALARRLLNKQFTSVYAANTLPDLLAVLGKGKQLFELAFSSTFPKHIVSTVGKQKLQHLRIRAAVLHSARNEDYNQLVRLLLELSTVASTNQRGADFLSDNPELVVISHDSQALRRLVEHRTRWPGATHARLAIAMGLSQDPDEGLRHAIKAFDWIQHWEESSEKRKHGQTGPDALDIAAIPFSLVALNRGIDATRCLQRYYPWYAFEISQHLFRLLDMSHALRAFPLSHVSNFLASLSSELGVLVAALSYCELHQSEQGTLLHKLSVACTRQQPIKLLQNDVVSPCGQYHLQDGLLKSAALAIYSGLEGQALTIVESIPSSSTGLHMFVDRFGTSDVFPFIARVAITSAAKQEILRYHSLLPQELSTLGESVEEGLSLTEFQNAVKQEYERQRQVDAEHTKRNSRTFIPQRQDLDKFIDELLGPLYRITSAFIATLSKDLSLRKQAVTNLANVWEELRSKVEKYSTRTNVEPLFSNLGRKLIEFSLWTLAIRDKQTVSSILHIFTADPELSDYSSVRMVSILANTPELHDLAGKTATLTKQAIEKADDVTYRANMYSQLAKAVFPASAEEAKWYFRNGLEQMDAIGSGDYQFTAELLGFVGTVEGEELSPADFHTLTNLCELNLTSEVGKYPWLHFGRALSRTSGCRALAKVGRWHDRGKVSLDYSLLPYLYSLLEIDKIDPATALGLLRLCNPVELRGCGTSDLAELIEKKKYPQSAKFIAELIRQFHQNNIGAGLPVTITKLGEVSVRVLGPDSRASRYLTEAGPHYQKVQDENNDRSNYSYSNCVSNSEWEKKRSEEAAQNQNLVDNLLTTTDPGNESSLSKAIAVCDGYVCAFELKKMLIDQLRDKIPFSERLKHVKLVASLDNITLILKLDALKACKSAWEDSSESVKGGFPSLATTIVRLHTEEFVTQGYFHGSALREVAQLCNCDIQDLILELIKLFAAPNRDLAPPVWLEIASIINLRTKGGEAQKALNRLLRGPIAKLSTMVVDGEWKKEMYLMGDEISISSGLTWMMLGSPSVIDRWRAAHAVRTFAHFGNWKIIDSLVSNISTRNAVPFQAPELPFYFFHARLWLLIALQRLASDYPNEISKYTDVIRGIAFDSAQPHILFRHFAAQTLLTCSMKGPLKLTEIERRELGKVDKSPFEPQRVSNRRVSNFSCQRPQSNPAPKDEFMIDYDFDRYSIESIADLFDVPRWTLHDKITNWVRSYDNTVKSMYEANGRTVDFRDRQMGINSKQQGYGNQLGWHALYLVVGQMLLSCPIIIGPYDGNDPWSEWLQGRTLSRRDGLWLADGMDPAPLDTQINLLETRPELTITSKKDRLLSLVKIGKTNFADVVIYGKWTTPDKVDVRITSAFANPEDIEYLVTEITKAIGFRASLPSEDIDDKNGQITIPPKNKTLPFYLVPRHDGGLDEKDPLGAIVAMLRPCLTKEIVELLEVSPADEFLRSWIDFQGNVVFQSHAWGSSDTNDDGEPEPGIRMTGSRDALKSVLTKKNLDLLILIVLCAHEKGYGGDEEKYWHSTAVVHITKALNIKFYPGLSSELHKSGRTNI